MKGDGQATTLNLEGDRIHAGAMIPLGGAILYERTWLYRSSTPRGGMKTTTNSQQMLTLQ